LPSACAPAPAKVAQTFVPHQSSNILPSLGLRQAILSQEIERADANPSWRSIAVASLPLEILFHAECSVSTTLHVIAKSNIRWASPAVA